MSWTIQRLLRRLGERPAPTGPQPILPSPMRNSGPGHERMAPADHMLRFEAEIIRAEWNWARAAACPWWAPVRRWCLVQRAQSCDRAAAMHFELAGQAARTHA